MREWFEACTHADFCVVTDKRKGRIVEGSTGDIDEEGGQVRNLIAYVRLQ